MESLTFLTPLLKVFERERSLKNIRGAEKAPARGIERGKTRQFERLGKGS